MKSRWAMLGAVSLVAALISAPADLHGQQTSTDPQHDHQPPAAAAAPATDGASADMMGMMARMKAADAKIDELVKRMHAATGAAKTDAMAELLTALVDDRRSNCEPMMTQMMSMMNMMNGGMHGANMPMPKK
jgi:hypothetical protein